ncbi:DUF4232 domain-containing protein [Streptomyces sp. NRRL B-24484]|uniref:DUF4232 domain-containing protein n=1 Tax=Streptomyces sp. NRRL B-24484 TaxID=1463833 RepID=UPI00069356ED|nr:DUF4232 domain-containing protein [Streptomyces sp. NRRL B-24484]
MRSRSLSTISVSVLLAGLGLTACGSGSTDDPPKAAGGAPVSAALLAGRPEARASASPLAGATATAAPGGSPAPPCSPEDLRWTVVRLTDAATDTRDPANAELVAANSGPGSCVLAGYPTLEFHLGKGPQAVGVGTGSPAPVTLGAGRKAVIALRYSEFNGKGPDSGNCVFVTASAAQVVAPGTDTVVRAPVVDRRSRPTEITICGDEVRMSPPTAR